MNPVEFIELASRLADAQDSGEAGYRSAVSRAYYGAYLSVLKFVAVDLAVPCKWGRENLSEHRVLQRFLMGCKTQEAIELGNWLSNLHQHRKDSDYEMDDKQFEVQDESQLCVQRARMIIARLNQCETGTLKQQIKAGIIQYRRDMKLST